MKRNNIPDISTKIFFQNYENLFNVYPTAGGEYFYNITRKVNISSDISSEYCTQHVVEHGDTWTFLAYKFYNDVKLWWIICLANEIQNPCLMPTPGFAINILNVGVVQEILTAMRDN
jgi:hypothetical protein